MNVVNITLNGDSIIPNGTTTTTNHTNGLDLTTHIVAGNASTWGRHRPRSIDLPSPEIVASIRERTRKAAPPQMRTEANGIRFENSTDSEMADVYIYDRIGYDWWTGEGTTAKQFAQDFRAITAPSITVHVNSPGGDVFDGIAIYNAIRSHPSDVTVRVEGIAASAASFIAMAGDRVLMAPHAMLMIHDAWGVCMGPAADMRAEADVLDQLSNNIASIYAEHASGPRGGSKGNTNTWREHMLAETWYSDEAAVEAGLADAIDREAPAAKNLFDLSHFQNAPAELLNATAEAQEVTDSEPTIRDAERALRDAGYSRREAVAILAAGYTTAMQGDPVPVEAEPTDDAPEPMSEETDPVFGDVVAEAEAMVRRANRTRELELFELLLL